ncbi:MAG: hypothetical protein HY741_23330 [Chloroflexi bacterium]|nr:hypothetical protein [Chloroflexota bacterium]
MLLMVLIWLVVPLTIRQWGRVPHTHILIGSVTSEEFVAHVVAEEQRNVMPEPLHYQSGWILSVPFGDLGAFLAFLLVVALPVGLSLSLPQLSSPIQAFVCALVQIHCEIPHPPPRFGRWVNAR